MQTRARSASKLAITVTQSKTKRKRSRESFLGQSVDQTDEAASGRVKRTLTDALDAAATPTSAATVAAAAASSVAALPSPPRSAPRASSPSSSRRCIANPAWLPHSPHHCQTPRLLIMGSMTGDMGLKKAEYYAHPQNAFYRIMESLLDEPGFASLEYRRRIDRLLCRGVCLWNVLESCERKGSLDSAIKNPVANDVASVLQRYPSIEVIGLNGGWAYNYFIKHVTKQQPIIAQRMAEGKIRVVQLLSSSPACAMANAVQVKTQRWREALNAHRLLPLTLTLHNNT